MNWMTYLGVDMFYSTTINLWDMRTQQRRKKTLRWKKWNEIEWITQDDIDTIIHAPVIEECFHRYLLPAIFGCSLLGNGLSCILFSLAHVYRGPDEPLSWTYALACLPPSLLYTFMVETARPDHITTEKSLFIWVVSVWFVYELLVFEWRSINKKNIYFITIKTIYYATLLGCCWRIYSGNMDSIASVRTLIRTIPLHMISNLIPILMIKFVHNFD